MPGRGGTTIRRRGHYRPFLVIGCWLCLTACSTLPIMAPDLSRRAGHAPVLQNSQGPLTSAQSKAILERLSAKGEDTGIFERHLVVEEAVVGSPLMTGNDVQLLQDGPATYRAMMTAIKGARDHINLETYILDDDEVGQRFALALMERQAQGIQVNLIRDSVGTMNTPATYFQRLVDAGVNVLEFNPINPAVSRKAWVLNQRDHRKLLIVDGHTAILGGINISSVYSSASFRQRVQNLPQVGPAWRDTDLRVVGPVVAELQKLFMASWEGQHGKPLAPRQYFPKIEPAGTEVVRAVGSSPEEPYSLIYVTLLSAINSAETRIQLTNAYFVPDPQLLASLEAAVSRGVEVTLILPSQTDSWLVFHAGRHYYSRLLRAGVRIFERRGVILHSKTALIDGVWSTVGSTNLDWRSFLHNYELNAVVLGAAFGSQLEAMFIKDLAQSDEIILSDWERRPLSVRVKESLANMWAYWL